MNSVIFRKMVDGYHMNSTKKSLKKFENFRAQQKKLKKKSFFFFKTRWLKNSWSYDYVNYPYVNSNLKRLNDTILDTQDL